MRSPEVEAARRSTVRLAKSNRAKPTSSVIMLLLTSNATIMSTPSDSTSWSRLPILGSSQAITSVARATRTSRNFHVGMKMRYPGRTLSMRPASANIWMALWRQRKKPAMASVSTAVKASTGTNSALSRVRLGTRDLAVSHPDTTVTQSRNSRNTSTPMAGRREGQVFIRPQIS